MGYLIMLGSAIVLLILIAVGIVVPTCDQPVEQETVELNEHK